MNIKDVKIGQVVTVATDNETHYKVVAINGHQVNLVKLSTNEPLSKVPCVELSLVFNS